MSTLTKTRKKHLEQRHEELRISLDMYNMRIAAMLNDISYTLDAEHKVVLESRLKWLQMERESVVYELDQLELQLSQNPSSDPKLPLASQHDLSDLPKPKEIREVLRRRFTTIDLEIICMDAGLDDSEMRTETIDTFAIDIVKTAQKLDKWPDLVRVVQSHPKYLSTSEAITTSLEQTKSLRLFLEAILFDLRAAKNPQDFVATPTLKIWRKKFPKGLYVQVCFDKETDRQTINALYQEAKSQTDHALLIINQQPDTSAWMQISTLRLGKNNGFTVLVLDYAQIKDSIVRNNEKRFFKSQVNKYLGEDYDPYYAVNPISDTIGFFGRETIIINLLKKLEAGQRVGVFGLHKVGKSSVLKRIQKATSFPTTYVYLASGKTLPTIYNDILKGWAIDTQIKYPQLEWKAPSLSPTDDIQLVFNETVTHLLSQLERVMDVPQIGILLDEIEKIIPYTESDKDKLPLYLKLMDNLRGLQQETESLSLMVAGIHPKLGRVNYFWGDEKNPMYQVISEVFLSPLDKKECEIMVRSLGQMVGLDYTPETVQYIYNLSGGHPFLARKICSLAYKAYNEIGTMPLEIVKQVAYSYIRSLDNYFDTNSLWQELGKEYIWGQAISQANHNILRLLATTPQGVSQADICTGENKLAKESALIALKEQHIITPIDNTDQYTIPIGLFQDWIRLYQL